MYVPAARQGKLEKQKMEVELEHTMQAALLLRAELLQCLADPGRQAAHPDAVCGTAPVAPRRPAQACAALAWN